MKLQSIIVFCLLFATACSSSNRITTTWKNPSFKSADPGKLIVYAKVSEPAFRSQVEDLIVKYFQQQGYNAIAAYNNFTEGDLKNADSIHAKAQSLDATSLITFKPLKKTSEVKSTSQISTSIGVGGSYGSFYNGFGGAIFPIAGKGKIEEHLILETNYYTQGSNSAEWLATMDVNTRDGLEQTIAKITEMLIDKMKKQGVL